jgi:hypothetical protein
MWWAGTDPANGAYRMAVGNFCGVASQHFAEPTSDFGVDAQMN